MTQASNIAIGSSQFNASGILQVAGGGTNSTAIPTAGGAIYGTGTAYATTAAGTSGNALISAGAGAPAFGNLALGVANTNVSGALTVTNGGTGLATLTANNVILGAGTATPTFVAPGTSGNVLTSNGTTWTSATASGLPAGTLIEYAGTSVPTGYLACPTAAATISRTTYAALFTAIGTTWGVGDGSTTFGIPWFAVGYTKTQSNSNVATATTGTIPAHTHSLAYIYSTSGNNGAYPQASTGSFAAGSTGSFGTGSTNLAASTAVLFCVKY